MENIGTRDGRWKPGRKVMLFVFYSPSSGTSKAIKWAMLIVGIEIIWGISFWRFNRYLMLTDFQSVFLENCDGKPCTCHVQNLPVQDLAIEITM